MFGTGIVTSDRYLDHRMGAYHIESPGRLEAVYSMLREPGRDDAYPAISPRPVERETLGLVHVPEYIDRIAETRGKDYCYLDPDTCTCPETYEVALLAAGGLCQAVSRVASGALQNAFALVRPPGHHAETARAMGFCIFNNVAVAAKFAQRTLGLDRILIVDWDLHHGNGTQHTFEQDPSVLYFSTHQYPFYPGTGALQDAGIGPGEGFTINVPLAPGCGDLEYLAVFDAILRPVAHEFHPDLILVSAGFDSFVRDPLGGMRVTVEGYAAMTRMLKDIAGSCCEGKLVLSLEGGYDHRGLRDSVQTVLKELSSQSDTSHEDLAIGEAPQGLGSLINRIKAVHRPHWKSL